MRNALALRLVTICTAVAGLAAGAANAQVAYVDAIDASCGSNYPCYRTIQAAVSAQPDNATIIVRPGTYREDYANDPNVSHDPNGLDIHGLWLFKNLQTIKSIDGTANDGTADTIIECTEPWAPYGGVRMTGTGNTLQGFKIIDSTPDSIHLEHAHYLVKVEGDNNSVFDNMLIGRGAGYRSDRGVLLQGEAFSTGGGDGLAYFNNVKRNEIYNTCYGIDVANTEPARIQDQSGIQCNTLHDDCKAISVRLDCALVATLPDPNNPLRPIQYNNIGRGEFAGLQIEYAGTCNPNIDATNNWWIDPSGPNVNGLGPGIGSDLKTVDGTNAYVSKPGVTYNPWLTAVQTGTCPPPPQGTIGDKVWGDTNGNGLQDSGETGQGSVTVELHKCDGTLFRSMVTANDGSYSFTLDPGDYYIKTVIPSGYTVSPKNAGTNTGLDSDADRTTGQTACTHLDGGERDLSWDVGLYKKAKIGDFTWSDGNADGMQESGSVGIANVTTKLYTCGGTLVSSSSSNSSGRYSFDADPGSYYLEFTRPNGYLISNKAQGTDRNIDNDADPATGRTDCFTVTSGQSDMSRDLGLNQKVNLGDRVWKDSNKNGIQDAGEGAMSGVTVKLLDCNSSYIKSTTTDSYGNYKFAYIDSGCYIVQFVKPSGYSITSRDKGSNDDADSDADTGTGKTTNINTSGGTAYTRWDCGLKPN